MKKILTSLLLLAVLGSAGLRAQTLDPAFQPTMLKVPFVGGLQTGPQLLLVQPDGKTLVGGGSDFANGALASKILRLNVDGTLDATFNPGGTGANGFIGAMALQPDGKIIIVGGFTVYNGTPAQAQARLNTNGTLDTSFAGLPLTSLRQLGSVAVQPDGKILVGGSTGFGTTPLPALVRLNANGTPDASFTPPASVAGDFVRVILVQADGKLVLGGNNSLSTSGLGVGVQRLMATGSPDATFSSPLAGSSSLIVYSLAQQPDGKLLVGGGLAPAGSANPGVLRLLPGGSIDNTFATGSGAATAAGAGALVRTLVLLANGNILVGGSFAQFNGVARGRVVRLLPTGAVDASFAAGAGANNGVLTLATTANGQVLAAGSLTQYDGGSTRTGLVRLTAAGAEDAAFAAPVLESRGTISQAALLANGQLQVLGSYTSFNGTTVPAGTALVRRINANGTLDATYSATASPMLGVQPDGSFFTLGTNAAGSQYTFLRMLAAGTLDNTFANPAYSSAASTAFVRPQGVVVQPNGKILVSGTFTTFGGAARNGLVRLNADGTVDNSFVPPAGTLQRQVYAVTVQPSGKIVMSYDELVAGSLTQLTNTGTVVVRLNPDGTPDNTYTTGTGPNAGASIGVLAQADGRVLLSGVSSYNGQATPYGIVRLTVDGAVDNTFNQLSAVYSLILVQPDGRILASTDYSQTAPTSYGANTLVRLNSNGSLDGTFAPISTPRNIFVNDNAFYDFLYQPADNKIIAYGSFTSMLGQARVGLARIIPGVVTATQAATATRPLLLYPNPAHQQLTVVLPAGSQSTQASLLSLTGQVVRQWALPARQPEATLDLGAVAAGLYVLRIPGLAGVYQQKVVVTP